MVAIVLIMRAISGSRSSSFFSVNPSASIPYIISFISMVSIVPICEDPSDFQILYGIHELHRPKEWAMNPSYWFVQILTNTLETETLLFFNSMTPIANPFTLNYVLGLFPDGNYCNFSMINRKKDVVLVGCFNILKVIPSSVLQWLFPYLEHVFQKG